MSYMEYLIKVTNQSHEQGQNYSKTAGHRVDYENAMTSSQASCKQPAEGCIYDSRNIRKDDLVNSFAAALRRSVINEEKDNQNDNCKMKELETKPNALHHKAVVSPFEPQTWSCCSSHKRGRNSRLKQKFNSLTSLENISEMDELESVVLVHLAEIDGDKNHDFNRNIKMSSKLSHDLGTAPENCVPLDISNREIFRLHEAAKNGNMDEIESFRKNNFPVNCLDSFGWTPLYNALERHQIEIAGLLLSIGANPSFQHKNGKTILHEMASVGNYKAIEMLVDHNVNVNDEDGNGWPALHDAMRKKHLKCAALLMSSGTDVAMYTAKRVEEYKKILSVVNMYKSTLPHCTNEAKPTNMQTELVKELSIHHDKSF